MAVLCWMSNNAGDTNNCQRMYVFVIHQNDELCRSSVGGGGFDLSPSAVFCDQSVGSPLDWGSRGGGGRSKTLSRRRQSGVMSGDHKNAVGESPLEGRDRDALINRCSRLQKRNRRLHACLRASDLFEVRSKNLNREIASGSSLSVFALLVLIFYNWDRTKHVFMSMITSKNLYNGSARSEHAKQAKFFL
uniref:Uncharacterized protein n=1 Tax=Steinernema glaseri TaxID=37863 RepID=A0A1I7ZWK3_9BILA